MSQVQSSMESAIYFQNIIEWTLKRTHDDGVYTGVDLSSYVIKDWNQDDLLRLAKAGITYDTFEMLVAIDRDAMARGKEHHPDTTKARDALLFLKPDCYADLTAFHLAIQAAAKQSEALRMHYRATYNAQKAKAVEELNGEKYGSVMQSNRLDHAAFTDAMKTIDPVRLAA